MQVPTLFLKKDENPQTIENNNVRIGFRGRVHYAEDNYDDIFIVGDKDEVIKNINDLFLLKKPLKCHHAINVEETTSGIYISNTIEIAPVDTTAMLFQLSNVPIPILGFYYSKQLFECNYWQ